MPELLYQPTTPQISEQRKRLAPGIHEAFDNFSRTVFAEGTLPEKANRLIAVAVSHVPQCPYCTASPGTPNWPAVRALSRRKSWKPFGSRRKCGPGARSCTPRWL